MGLSKLQYSSLIGMRQISAYLNGRVPEMFMFLRSMFRKDQEKRFNVIEKLYEPLDNLRPLAMAPQNHGLPVSLHCPLLVGLGFEGHR